MKDLKNRPYALRLFHAAITGQAFSAAGVVCMLRANIGLEPWSTFQQGLSGALGISFGVANDIVGVTAVVLALLLGETIGIGTLCSIFVMGVGIDVIQWLDFIPVQQTVWGGVVQLLAGLELLVIGTFLYMREGLGSGARDALMVGLSKKTGRTPGFCRTCMEGLVLALGWLMGAPVGLGTVLAMAGIGLLIDFNFHLVRFDPKAVRQETLADAWRRLCAIGAGN